MKENASPAALCFSILQFDIERWRIFAIDEKVARTANITDWEI
jgi:hypothetical protein